MASITITRTGPKGATYTIIMDRRDLAYYRRYNCWQKHKKGLIRYDGQRKGKGSVLFHRAILEAAPTDFVEFKNGDKFDVRRSNIRVRNDAEWRARKRKPFIITRTRTGKPTGVSFNAKVHHWKTGGRTTTHRYATATFCHRRKEHHKSFNIDTFGLEEAVRLALAWRVSMIRKHGLKPNKELLAMLDRVTRMIGSGCLLNIYDGNAEYETSKVVGHETSFQVRGFNYKEAA